MADGKSVKRWVRIIFDRLSAKKTEAEMAASLGAAGKKGGENFLRELRAAFDKKLADLRVKLAAGLVSPKEFRAQANLAAKEFNAGLLQNMEKARAAGKLTDAEYLKLSRTLKRVGDEGASTWDRIKAGIVRAGTALVVAFGIRGGIRFAFSAIQEFISSEKVWRELSGTVDAAGVSFAGLEKRVRAAAAAFQDATVHSDEDYANSLQRLIAITGDVEGSIRNMTLVADIAARFFGGDLAAATDTVSKAMVNGEVKINKVNFSLEELAKRSKGAAAESAGTLAGKIQQLNNQWGEFKEQIGGVLVGSKDTVGVLDLLTTSVKSMVKWVDDNKEALQQWVANGVNVAISALRELWGLVKDVSQAMGNLSLTAGTVAAPLSDDAEILKNQIEGFKKQRKQLDAERVAAQQALDKFLAPNALETAKRILSPIRTVKKGNELELELRAVNDQLKKVDDNAERARLKLQGMGKALEEKPGPGGGGGILGKKGEEASKRAKELGAELEKVEREIAVTRLQIDHGLTEAQAAEQIRREQILSGHVAKTVASVEELVAAYKRLQDAQLILRADLESIPKLAPRTEPQLKLGAAPTEFPRFGEDAASKAKIDAAQFESPWVEALERIEKHAEGFRGLFGELGEIWAAEGAAGLAKLAKVKVFEMVAAAAEMVAQSIGAFASGNFFKGAQSAVAAVKYGVAAVQWAKVAGGGGGGAGASSTGGVSSGAPNQPRAGAVEKQSPEVHIHFKGSSFFLPEVQKQIYASQLEAREKYGPNTKVIVHRGP